MAYNRYYSQWVDAGYSSDGTVTAPSPTPFTAASAAHWDNAHAAALPQTSKGDLVSYTGTETVRVPLGATNAVLIADPSQTSGLRWSITDYVPSSQRSPFGGVTTIAYASTITPNAATSNAGRCTATGNLTVNPPNNASDGQLYMLYVTASGANRTVTLAAGVVLTTGTTRAFTVTSAQRGRFGLQYDGELGAWLIIAQTQTIAG